jgi:putative transposase
MARNYYSEINLHFVWHVKYGRPVLTPDVESLVHRALRRKIVDWPGAFVHEIGGTETHVHLAVTIAPTIMPSEMIGQLKGFCSHEVNQMLGAGKGIEWQTGYGVVSFGTRDLPWVKAYIRNQKEHHAAGQAQERLERITQDDA